MAHYADQISTLPLLKQLRASKGRDDVSTAEVEQLVAMVLDTADAIGPLLERIPLTFQQYTQHDLRHSANIIKLLGKFIPPHTQKRLNAVELAILAIAAIVHDSGMFVSDGEKAVVIGSPEYRRYEAAQGERSALLEKARASGEHLRSTALQDALLAEYFRRLHPERAADVVKRHLKDRLTFRGTDLIPAVLHVAESHGWGVLESNDPRDSEKSVSRLGTRKPVSSVPVNEQYLACCLRLADIMDFDRSRTPASVFQHLGFTEEKSWEEWNKHLQVTGWHVDEHEVMYSAPCSHPAFYVAVMEFLDWIDAELRDCRHLIREAPQNIADRYELNLPPVVDRRQVEMEDRSYLAGAFRFQLDYERIMQLLMDRSLYPDPSLFLRELLQNALDACRTRDAQARAANAAYTARITVWDHSDDLEDPRIVFQDNGVGMSRRIVENYFMRVGRSYYKSAEFDLERQRLAAKGVELEATSQFGIGILSCFMVSDQFEVETYRVGNRPLHIKIEGPTKYFVIRLLPEPARADFPIRPSSAFLDGPPDHPGTRLTVHLRPGISLPVKQVLEQFAVNVDFHIDVIGSTGLETYRIPARKWRDQQVKPSKYPTILEHTGTGKVDSKTLAAALDAILVPVQVPLRNYDFAAHLDGQAWFWLLRNSKGDPSPSQGYLQLRAGLRCSGVAAFAGSLVDLDQRGTLDLLEISFDGLVEQIEDALMSEDNPFAELDVPLAADLHGGISHDFWDSFSDKWDALSYDERCAVYDSLSKYHRGAVAWYANKEVAKDLLRGGLEWANAPIDLAREIAVLAPAQGLAMHGIRLSAGVVSWDPMTGTGNRQEFLVAAGGLAIDIRGGSNIVPAASRLFVDSRDADQIAIPLLRALIRFGTGLASLKHGPDGIEWREWLNSVVTPLFYHERWNRQLVELEQSHVERTNGYLCRIAGAQVLMTGEQLVDRFGDWIPISGFGRGEGIEAFDRTNLLLLTHKPRDRRNGIEVVDLATGIEQRLTGQM
jgi:hypothetical protein